MSRRVRRALCGSTLAAACLGAGIEASRFDDQVPQAARAARANTAVTWDFETGNLLGWQASGRAFAFQPTLGDNPRARQREPANPQGRYWLGTYERYQGRGEPGATQGDEPQGTLTSIAFTVPVSLSMRSKSLMWA